MTAKPLTFSRGAGFALLAAVCFGVTTPVVAWAGRGLGAFATASLLYTGACLCALGLKAAFGASGAPLRRAHGPRLFAIAFMGAVIAPVLLAWGLQRAGGVVGSLLLNFEGVFTVLLAFVVFREPIGRRVVFAVALMALGSGALALAGASERTSTWLGIIAVAGATLAWAIDNTLTRALAERDPSSVVAWKAVLGALCTGLLAVAAREPSPSIKTAIVVVACGASGYGLSLRLYLLAQRTIGGARTGSLFAVAPFVGAALAWAMGERTASPWMLVSIVFFAGGVAAHLMERHRHSHFHQAVEHEHEHTHDDDHHTHVHEPLFVGTHTHPHRHERQEHEHEHTPDGHHDHAHG